MQELKLNIKIRDIQKGEEPPESGWYYIELLEQDIPTFAPMWWDAEKRAWRIYKTSDLFEPATYWGRYWTEVFLKGLGK